MKQIEFSDYSIEGNRFPNCPNCGKPARIYSDYRIGKNDEFIVRLACSYCKYVTEKIYVPSRWSVITDKEYYDSI